MIEVFIRTWFQRLYGNTYNAFTISYNGQHVTSDICYGGDAVAKADAKTMLSDCVRAGVFPSGVDVTFTTTEVRSRKDLSFR